MRDLPMRILPGFFAITLGALATSACSSVLVRGAPVGSAARPRPEQRLREGERIFDILTVTEHDPAGRYLEIVAEEGVMP